TLSGTACFMRIAGENFVERATEIRRTADLSQMAQEIAGHIPRMFRACQTEREFEQWFEGEVESVRRNAADPMEAAKLVQQLRDALESSRSPAPVAHAFD